MTSSVNSQNFNMATKQEILQAADQLWNNFTQSATRLDSMNPPDQVAHVNTIEQPYEGYRLLENSMILTGLQKRVSATYDKAWGYIPDTSEDELKVISDKLQKSTNLLDSIRDNCVLAKDICELFDASTRIFREDRDPSEVSSLQGRITQLKSTHTINVGNRTALEQLEATIITATTVPGQINLPIALIPSPKLNVTLTVVQPSALMVQSDKLEVEKEQPQEFRLNPLNIDPNEMSSRDCITQLKSIDTINVDNKTVLEQMETTIITATTAPGQIDPPIILISSPKLNVIPTVVQPSASIVQLDKLEVEKEQPQEFRLDPQVQKILDHLQQINDSTEISSECKKEIFNTVLTIVKASPLAAITPSSQAVIAIAEKKVDAIQELQGLLPLFQSASHQNLELGLENLAALKSKEIKLPFKISSKTPVNIADRPCFHLYFIHKKESPQNLKNDRNYGDQAMKGVYPASNTERLRAIGRTIAELTLQKLEDAVSSNRLEDVSVALSTLEELKMTTNDMPPGQNNLAYILFGKMYHKHVEARKNNASLINPNDRRFQGDFGRNAFGTVDGINSADKVAVVNELLLDLKNVWKIA